MKGLKLITPPAIEPITLVEAKAQCRVDGTDEDALIQTYIAAARQHGEGLTGRQFVEAVYELVLDEFPGVGGAIELPRPPLQSVESVTYVDQDGVMQTMGPSAYTVDPDSLIGRILPASGTTWPATKDMPGAVRVRFGTGWPVVDGKATTPDAIRAWMLLRVAGLYAQREPFVVGTVQATIGRDFTDGLLDPWTIVEVA